MYSIKSSEDFEKLSPFIIIGAGGGGEKFSNFAGVETAEAKVRQTETRVEHVTHVRHFRGVEFVYVKARQTTAAIEHIPHRFHPGSIPAAHVHT